MKITPRIRFVSGSFDTKEVKLVLVPSDNHGLVELCVKEPDPLDAHTYALTPRHKHREDMTDKTLESLDKTADMIFALHYALKEQKEQIGFAPLELSKAIDSLAEAERYLRRAILKMKGI